MRRSIIRPSIQPAETAKAGEALKTNLAAEAAMYTEMPTHTTTKMKWGLMFLGTLYAAHPIPMRDSQNVTMPKDMARLENPGACASEMVL
ncbi:MAG: hypothetical protein A4E29_00702 [Methanomassiliicoccales archaeon PtaB.Bin134]|nr:MAG: hypothetical protein A4E29_00702 [Methanomassiliicoccales archaeon PtaB.Bin134]